MNPEWTLAARGAKKAEGVVFAPFTGGHGELQVVMTEDYFEQIGEPATITIQIVRTRSKTGGGVVRR